MREQLKIQIIDHTILRLEGGSIYNDDPPDRSGASRYGISAGLLRRLYAQGDSYGSEVFSSRSPDFESRIGNLGWADATKIFSDHFWFSYFDELLLIAPTMTAKLFALSVSMGEQEAVQKLQQALITLEMHPGRVDGTFDSRTQRAVREAVANNGEHQLVPALADEAKRYYRAVVERDATKERFLESWLKRADDIFTPDPNY